MSIIKRFINANAVAYGKASKVFKAIEAEDYATTLAEAGIMGRDIEVYATIYVAEQTGVEPHPSQRDKSKLVFKKDSSEYNRVKYIVDTATGVREARKVKKAKAEKHNRISREVRVAGEAFLEMFDSVEAAVKTLRSIAK